MKKCFLGRYLPLVVGLLLILQLTVPSVNASAMTNNNILPPSNLSLQLVTPSDVKITWSSVFGATGYKVYGIIDGQLVPIGTTTSVSYTINNVQEGSYSYVVATLSPDGESGPCAPISVDIVYPTVVAPTTLTSKVQNGNDIVLNWSASQYAQSYNIYRVNDDGQNTLVISTKSLTFTITNAAVGAYSYAVSAVNSLYGESSPSVTTQQDIAFPVMTAPNNLTYTITNVNNITLKWNAVSYATAYKVYQIVDGQRNFISNAATTALAINNLEPGEYVYEVHSYSDRFGESLEGSQISATVYSQEMQAPDNLTNNISNVNDVTLKWNAASYATAYRVYQIIDGQKVFKNTITSTTVTYSNLPAGDYTYEVHSYSSSFGESQNGSQTSFTITWPTMQEPANGLYNIANGNDIALSWTSVPYATAYKVYQVVNGQKILKSTVSGTTATYTNMPEGAYAYEIHSYSSRFGESQEGSTITLSLVHPVMQAPENVLQTIKNTTDFTLNWDTSAYATSYKVYQIVNGQKVLKSTVTGTTVTYTGMAPGSYEYEIHSYSTRFGESVDGSSITVTMNGQTMLAPINLTYSIANGNDITLRWTAAQYATSYKIYQVIDGQSILKKTVTGTYVTFTNSSGGDYDYVVNSVSTLLGESPSGAEIALSLVLPVMEDPANLTEKIQNGNDVVLTWSAVTYANNYKIYELVDGQLTLKTTVTTTTATFTNVQEGDHTYVVKSSSSRFGESQLGSQASISVIYPTMLAPENLTNSIANGNDITLKWNAVSYATGYKIYQIIDGQEVFKQTVTGTVVTFANMPQGEYNFEVHSYSSRFDESETGSQTSFTLVFPIMQAPTNLTNSIANGNDITIRWSASTYAASYKIYLMVNGERTLKLTTTSTSATFTNMPEGDYSYEIHSFSNRFGESPTGSIVNFTLTWPVLLPPVLSGTVFNINNITFTWKAVTWANEYRVYETKNETKQLLYKGTALSYKIYNLSEDTHNFQITAYNTRFGESVLSDSVTEAIVYPVMQPPVASLKLLDKTSAQITWNFATYSNGYNVYEIIDNKPVLLVQNLNNLTYTVNNLSYKDHQFYVSSYSNSFGESNPSNTVIAKLIIDTEAPITSSDVSDNWTAQSPIRVNLSSTDNETGVAATYYSVNDADFVEGKSLVIEEEGITKISFYSVDNVGNKESTKSVYVKVDKTAPVTMSNAPTNWTNKDVEIKLIATDMLSGEYKTFYSIDGSNFLEGKSFEIQNEGIHKVSFYSVDNAGNVESIKITYVKIDKTAPATMSDAPTNWTSKDVVVNLATTDELSGESKIFYSIDGSNFLEGATFVIQSEGIHEVSYYSVDNAGNVEDTKIEHVKIDKTAPILIMDLANEYKLGATQQLTYLANDNFSGVTKETMLVFGPGEPIGKTVINGTYIDISKPGTYTVTVSVTNAAGLTATIQKQFVVYIQANIEVTAKVMKGNNGILTVRVELPEGYKNQNINLDTATLNGVKALTINNGYYEQARIGQFKFERSEFNWTGPEVKVEFRCYVDGYLVVGQAMVKVQK